ncbi:MAG: 30S ribosome-binding factor RbfA [Eubacteriales bacterium]|jgi:ribosome-binding factor A|nr:30S ribosome-binding factor RbfA [Eubacteriales bacterium]
MATFRADRRNEEVKKTISEVIREMKDPRISPMTALTEVEVTKDLKFAKVKVSVYDEDEKKRISSVEALNHAAGFISHQLGARMRIRAVPSIKFTLDNTIAYSIRIAEILNGLIKTDASEAWPEEGQLHQKEEEE